MITTIEQYNKRSQAIRDLIIKLIFKDKKQTVTEVTIKREIDCYNVNIEAVVRQINDSGLYPVISCIKNSYGVLSLVV